MELAPRVVLVGLVPQAARVVPAQVQASVSRLVLVSGQELPLPVWLPPLAQPRLAPVSGPALGAPVFLLPVSLEAFLPPPPQVLWA